MLSEVMPFSLFSYEIFKKKKVSWFPFCFSKMNQLQHIEPEMFLKIALLKTKLLQITKKNIRCL